ncbi:MAG: hypothetical protein ACRECH_12635, partial [Nitrososphaerales archaeon]
RLRPFSAPTCNPMKVTTIDCDYTFGRGTIYSFVMPPDYLVASLRNPIVEALASTSLPISIAGRYFPLRFWWIPPINAATYAAVGLIVETLRLKLHPRSLLNRPTA